jgi:hypothetical protein
MKQLQLLWHLKESSHNQEEGSQKKQQVIHAVVQDL